MYFYIISLVISTTASIKQYKKTAIILWIGFFLSLFTRPWHEFRGFEGMVEGFILLLIVFPIYIVGFISWIVGYLQRKKQSKIKVEHQL
ncbi:hypothetical protein CVD28_02365 [Bacillus sp. M6-12]|uniref:hypothetical protein n=1 Tax=Bacillus sp. M6-12 TaxID=2054166 RepID=UPI000C76D00A|nr:hypothetical protein [Bacillus sp. M6-12]PLS19276.1 hypothetical protein CVD28_02365 [Bacillus sp. M6-12]